MHDIASMFSGSQSVLFLYLISFVGGVIASVSPCSLAMLPIIVGYVGGYSNEKTSKTFVQLLFFIIGSAIVFSIFGIFCAITGKVFVSFAGGYFGLIMASIIMVMGLKLVGFLDFELPVIIKEMPHSDGTNTFLYPMILGGAVGGNALLYSDFGSDNGFCISVSQYSSVGCHVIFVCAWTGVDSCVCGCVNGKT